VVNSNPQVAVPDEPLRVTVFRMAETGFTRFPVVEKDGSGKLVGMVSLDDLLKARAQTLDAERRRERVLPLRLKFPLRKQKSPAA
jgi:CBS domain-containing protein